MTGTLFFLTAAFWLRARDIPPLLIMLLLLCLPLRVGCDLACILFWASPLRDCAWAAAADPTTDLSHEEGGTKRGGRSDGEMMQEEGGLLCRAVLFWGKFLPPFVISSSLPLPKRRRARSVFPVRFVWSGMGRGGGGGEAKMSIFVAEWGSSITQKCAPTTSQPLKKVEMCRRCLDRCSSKGVRFLSLCCEAVRTRLQCRKRWKHETDKFCVRAPPQRQAGIRFGIGFWGRKILKCAEQGRIFPPSEAGRRQKKASTHRGREEEGS